MSPLDVFLLALIVLAYWAGYLPAKWWTGRKHRDALVRAHDKADR